MNSDDDNQELQPGASGKGYAVADDTTNSDGDNQKLQPGASGEGYGTGDDTAPKNIITGQGNFHLCS